MPAPARFITAYRTRDGRGGLLLRLSAETGEQVFGLISAERAALEAEIGSTLLLRSEAREPFNGLVEITYPDDAGSDEAFLDWLLKTANRAITALRPLLNAATAEP